ncbi:MAG: transposase [Candidatus Thermoplasmatota archaeon]|jgi:transposase-like protein|nr:transposase [Candidatus Thermoplasmatota archaeon]
MVGKGTYRTKEEKARIVMEILANSAPVTEICKRYNVASSAVYKWRDEFIRAGTAAMDPGRSSSDQKLMRENQDLKEIIGDLTIANETLKKIQLTRRGGRQ